MPLQQERQLSQMTRGGADAAIDIVQSNVRVGSEEPSVRQPAAKGGRRRGDGDATALEGAHEVQPLSGLHISLQVADDAARLVHVFRRLEHVVQLAEQYQWLPK